MKDADELPPIAKAGLRFIRRMSVFYGALRSEHNKLKDGNPIERMNTAANKAAEIAAKESP